MEDHGHHGSGSFGPPLRIKAKSMNLQKCDFCRNRKVRCEPQNREWPDKCNHCQRRGEKCSPPRFAARNSRIRHASDPARPASSSHHIIIEASTALHEEALLGSGGSDATLPGKATRIELTYQQMKDIITVLRCHHTEYRVEMSQSQWLESFFRNNEKFGEIEKKQFLEKVSNRLRAMSRIQKRTLEHVKSLLEPNKHQSLAERTLICQLLVDLETSFSTFTSDSETLYHQDDSFFASDQQRRLATLLRKSGDYTGALTLLHRLPLAQVIEKDLPSMVQIGVDLCSRMKMVPRILGMDDDPMVLDVFKDLDVLVLVLPYSLLAVQSNQWVDNDLFIKRSFMWPWIRRSLRNQLENQPAAQVNSLPAEPSDRRSRPSTTTPPQPEKQRYYQEILDRVLDSSSTGTSLGLDPDFRDAFGHTFLHAAILSQDNDQIKEILKKYLGPDQRCMIPHLVMEWPSYAPGFTALACSATSLADWEIFEALLSFSGKYYCYGSDSGTTSHKFCALTVAVRNQEYAVVKALVERSSQQKVDISNCCQWAMGSITGIPLKTWNLLAQTLRQPAAGSKENAEEILGEHVVYSQWAALSAKSAQIPETDPNSAGVIYSQWAALYAKLYPSGQIQETDPNFAGVIE